MRSIA